MDEMAITIKDVAMLGSVLGSALSLGWWLRSQIDSLGQRLAKMETQMQHWESQYTQLDQHTKEARDGRASLHERVNDLKDRVLRLEVKNKMTVGGK